MACPNCNHKNPNKAKFCINCGLSLSPNLKSSHDSRSFAEKLDTLQRYLPNGLVSKILAQRHKIEGERKLVTVMFCDMEGFVALVEKIGPEKSYRIMDKVYEILIHKVHEFEGSVNEMTGDGIMALFGAPIALEDAPQRAVRASLAIHREMAAFSEKITRERQEIAPLKMRIGIHTGPVIVGTLGNDLRVEFKAVGNTVNLASRMEGLAEPGKTYITKDTFELTKGLFRFKALGEKAIKGKKKAISVYKVISAKEDIYRPRLGSERMIYSDMVGRDKELNQLELQVLKAINGEGSVVNIIGEAGIGKSRLMTELKNCDAIKRVAILEGQAVSIGRNLSFYPIIGILKQWLQIKYDDTEEIAFNKLESSIKRLYPDEIDEKLPFIATLVGVKVPKHYSKRIKGIEGEALEKLIFNSVRELLIRATELTPIVIILEDLQWADTSSIELLESMFCLTESQRILFLNLFRPGYKETGNRIVRFLKEQPSVYSVDIWLEPLYENYSEVMIKNILGNSRLSYNITSQIVNRSGGNPYFIEEVVRSLIDESALVLKDGAFSVTNKLNTISIPSTINDVLMARIDRLEDAALELVRTASIVGRSFFYRIIKNVAGEAADIDQKLLYLKERQIISELSRMGELEYTFKHALAQEAVYLSILPSKRKSLHLKVANSIESVFSNKLHEFYGILSYHYSIGEDLDKAEYYMRKAGDEAMKISASSEALIYYKNALELYINKCGDSADKKKIAWLEENIAVAFFNKGYFVEAVNYFERALNNYGLKIIRNPIILAIEFTFNMLKILKFLYLPTFSFPKTPSDTDVRIMNLKFKLALSLAYIDIRRVFLDNIRNIFQSFKFDISKASIYMNVLMGGCALFAVTGISFRISQRIIDFVKKNALNKYDNNTIPISFYRFMECLYNCLAGNWHQMLDDEFVNKTLKVGDVSSASGYLIWLGYSKIETGDFDDAKKIIDLLNNIAGKYNFEHAKLDYYYLSAKLSIKIGKLYDAKSFNDKARTVLDKTGLDMRRIEFLGLKAINLTLMKDFNAAKVVIAEAENLIDKLGQNSILPNYLSEFLIGKQLYNLCMLENCIIAGNKMQLITLKKTSLKVAKQNARHFKRRSAVGRTEAYKLIGRHYWLVKRPKAALKWWFRSIQEGNRLNAKPETFNTCIEVGERLNVNPDSVIKLNGKNFKEYFKRAKTIMNK